MRLTLDNVGNKKSGTRFFSGLQPRDPVLLVCCYPSPEKKASVGRTLLRQTRVERMVELRTRNSRLVGETQFTSMACQQDSWTSSFPNSQIPEILEYIVLVALQTWVRSSNGEMISASFASTPSLDNQVLLPHDKTLKVGKEFLDHACPFFHVILIRKSIQLEQWWLEFKTQDQQYLHCLDSC